MCRVAGITKVNDSNREDAWLFMMVLGEYMSRWNNDGLGYAAFNKEGALFGERWLLNKTAFCGFKDDIDPELKRKFYSKFGPVDRNQAQGIILHARAATCDKSIENTHPFLNDEDSPSSTIIHNGVISNHDDFLKKYSTCDSEVIVHLYDEFKVSENLDNLSALFNKMNGWFTVLGLSKDPSGRMIMDIFTDGPRLASFFVKELDTRVFSTSAMDIEATAKEFGMTLSYPMLAKANTAIRIDVLTGEIVAASKFEEQNYEVEEYESNYGRR